MICHMHCVALKPSSTNYIMHISPTALDSTTILVSSMTAIFAFGAACRGARQDFRLNKLPSFLGVTALVFLAQMVHVSTGFGFSTHLLGGLLFAVLFGPSSAVVAMGLVLTAQVVFLGDGTWATLGANFLMMGVFAVYAGYSVYGLLGGSRSAGFNPTQLLIFALSVLASIAVSAAFASFLIGHSFGSITLSYLLSGLLELGLYVVFFALSFRRREYWSPSERLPKLLPVAGLCLLFISLMPWSSEQLDGLEFASAKTISVVD